MYNTHVLARVYMHVLVHHFSRQLMVSLSCECCDDYDDDDDDINKGHGQLTTAAMPA